MKKLTSFLFSFVIAFTSSMGSVANAEEITINTPTQWSVSPITRVMFKFQTLKEIEKEQRSKQAFKELINDLTQLNEKDHNQALFSILRVGESDIDNRDFIIEVLSNWEQEGSAKAKQFAPASGWYHAVNLSVAALGALTIRRMVKGGFVTPVLDRTVAPQTATINQRLRGFLEQKIAKLNLGRLATKANLIANASAGASFLGFVLMMDTQFYDAIIHNLYDLVGPENIEFFQIFYSTKLPPLGLWLMVENIILCENHSRVVEISNSPEFQKDVLQEEDKTKLKGYLTEINEQINPNLDSISSNIINKNKANAFMLDGLRTKADKQLQYSIKDNKTKANNPYADRVLMCDQTAMIHTKSNINHIKAVIEAKLSDQ